MPEWVDFEPRPGQRVAFREKYDTVGALRAWARLGAAGEALGKGAQPGEALTALDEMCGALAVLVVDWDLVDEEGQALPPPTNAAAFYELSIGDDGEMAWLIRTLGERLNPDPK